MLVMAYLRWFEHCSRLCDRPTCQASPTIFTVIFEVEARTAFRSCFPLLRLLPEASLLPHGHLFCRAPHTARMPERHVLLIRGRDSCVSIGQKLRFHGLFSLIYCLHWLPSVSLRLKAQRMIRVSFGVYFAALCLAYSSGVNLPPFT